MKIKASENGPYLIEVAEAKILTHEKEEVLQQKTIALCRCGQSSKKPFCDGTHRKINFQAEAIEIEIK